jgi:hypothetical protein
MAIMRAPAEDVLAADLAQKIENLSLDLNDLLDGVEKDNLTIINRIARGLDSYVLAPIGKYHIEIIAGIATTLTIGMLLYHWNISGGKWGTWFRNLRFPWCKSPMIGTKSVGVSAMDGGRTAHLILTEKIIKDKKTGIWRSEKFIRDHQAEKLVADNAANY